ncbi:hypothetical protein GE09DRAFT_1251074 [Coniochaeta sp. 2T2.1]|nr:hypothetical protein GE09DRAFT_1251074 [Coniochaeta sp. 2T2.1]
MPPGSTNKQIQRYEFTAVYTHPDAKVDIILVHGLNGDPQRTWTASNGVFWPSDLLPDSLKTEHANVLVYGYNADVYSSRNDRSASNNFIHHHAQSLIATLTAYRKSEGTLKNPIIWVVHSLGGILTKRALLYSNDVRTENHNDLRSVYVSTYGIIFLGTPHTGSGLATWGHMLQFMSEAVIPKKLFETEPVLIKTLRKDNETLQNINNHFLDIYQRFQIHMAHENHKTDLKGSKAVVVDPASASPQLPGVTYYGIESTHSGMCKFESNTAPGYRTVSTAIRDWVKEASNVIQVRWLVELDDRQVRQQLEIHERRLRQLGGQPANAETQMMVPEVESPLTPNLPQVPPLALTHDSTQSDIIDVTVPQTRESPLFIHPEPFRPNSYFVGRDEEMKRLHKMLMDRGKRAQGTSAVLIQCLPGGGKTHLARQYVFEHRDDYPGGVYWVRAKSQNETEYWYWRIAKNEALRGLVSQEDVQELRDPKKIVAIVRKWLNSLDNWLLVLDGVHFDDPGLQEFIPDAKNTSLIFTSTERAVIEDYRFDSPEVMELPLIAVQDATDLFLLEMGRKKPWTQDDRARALELVQLMGRLPLMIHVAAQQLKATREPLSKYLRSYKNRAQAGTLPAYKSVRDQLQHRGATSALNLISIVVFFDQHVPVEMLTLGMSALDNRTPLKTPDASRRKANLTNTLKVLIAFALLERTEIQDISPVSSRSSKQAFDRAGESLDILRIHSVVQQFFIDTLSEEKQAPFWLERAAAVWCRSFDEADKKIKEHSSVGLPDDYRRFAIHGRRLLEHVKRFEKRSPELLGLVKGNIEQRLDRTQSQIERLSQTLQTSIVEGSQEIPATSVFERTNSSSETDSLTPPSHSSTSTTSVLRDGDESPELFQSPTTPGADFAHNPYHFHVPYPQHQTIPVPRDPSDLNDDSKTVTGSPNIGTLPDGPPKTGENGHIRNDRHGSDWDFIVPNLNHRSVRKLEHNRYHDRGGSWRDTSISDPRVSISREIAKGSITSKAPRSQSTSRVTAGSEAELHLHRIRKSLPSSEDKPLPHERSVSSGSLPRPRFLMGNNVPAEALATKTPEDEYSMSPVEFSNSLAKIAAAPSSWTAATLKKLKENIQPTEPTTDEPNPQANLASSPAPLFAGSGTRSAGSSPASRSSPFTPPAPPPPLEVEINTTTSLRRGAHPTIRQWETHAYHPTLSRLDSSSLANFDTTDPMSFSYPSIQHPPPPTTHTLHPSRLAQVQLTSPGGYTSEPMSRNPSGGSAVSAAESANPPSSSSPFTASVSRGRRDSSSGGSIRNRLLPFLIPGWRRRRPSHTETEPSPRLGDAFGEVETSYSRWEERHHHNQMDDESVLASSQWTPVQPRDRGGGRSQSQSPAPRGRRGQQGATRGSGRVESDSRARGGSSLGGEAMARHGSGSGSGSGSGGLRLADGRVVEFGERRGSGNVRIDGAGAGTEIGRDSEKEEGLGLGISMEE